MSYFCLNLGQTAEDSDMFTIIWLRPRGLNKANYVGGQLNKVLSLYTCGWPGSPLINIIIKILILPCKSVGSTA